MQGRGAEEGEGTVKGSARGVQGECTGAGAVKGSEGRGCKGGYRVWHNLVRQPILIGTITVRYGIHFQCTVQEI